ncbi:Crp/Fnr family transcriptional regulator [Streptomyces sp. NPDC002143]
MHRVISPERRNARTLTAEGLPPDRLSQHRGGAGHPLHRLSPGAREAWDATFLAALPADVTSRILDRAVETRLEAGEVFYRSAHHSDTALIAIVIDGLLRFCINAPDGRALTVRYACQGEMIGARGLALGGIGERGSFSRGARGVLGEASVNGEVLQAGRILVLPLSTFLHLAHTNVTLAWALAEEIAKQAAQDQELLATNVFNPIRSRVARHLLNLAVREGRELIVTASHQEIAGAIGSVREVVSRTLGCFQTDGLVERRGRRLALIDVARLHSCSLS